MIATPKLIDELRAKTRIIIDKELEALILHTYSTEPYPHTYTEQDLYEQIRKLVMRYNEDRSVTWAETKTADADESPWPRKEIAPQPSTPKAGGGKQKTADQA